MGYIKKAYRNMLDEIDSRSNDLPDKWDEFVKEVKIDHNLIIKKSKNLFLCTNCKSEFNTHKKIGEYEKCPYCHNKYLIRSIQLKNYYFIDNLILLDKVQNQLIFRYFEIWSKYDKENMYYGFKTSVVEYGRSFFDKRMKVVNDRVSKCQCYIHVNHLYNHGKWREYTRNYDFANKGYVYYYNLDKIIKNTEFQYLKLKSFAKYFKFLNIEYFLERNGYNQSTEMLLKLKLYELAFESSAFKHGKTFKEIFGLSKDFYPFIKRNKLNYRELKILQLLQEKDIRKIRYLRHYNEYVIEEIAELIDLNKFIKYAKMHRGKVDIYTYKDYIKFAKSLGLDLKNKRILYPENLKEQHDILEKEYKIESRNIINKSINKRYQELKKYEFEKDKFIIIPANSMESLENESEQQSNCVRTYSEKYADGKCDIYFMRKKSNKNKSLVTVEVRNNEVVQSRAKYNASPTEEQLIFLALWQKEILQQCRV